MEFNMSKISNYNTCNYKIHSNINFWTSTDQNLSGKLKFEADPVVKNWLKDRIILTNSGLKKIPWSEISKA